MTTALIVGFLWVLLGTVTAMLPMRHQMVPGMILLLSAPILIVLIGMDYGLWVAVIAALAFLSMMRNPLRYFWKKARGQEVELPVEMQKRGKS